MKFLTLYRVSFNLMLFFATLTLSVDSPENPLALLFPLAVALAAVVSLLTVDRNPRLGLTRRVADWLGGASMGLVFVEWSNNPINLLQALSHWLVYLQLIKMFLPKRVEDDWFLFLLGLMQVLVGAVGSQSDQVGQTMAAWALLSLWVLSLFALHREALRFLAYSDQPADQVNVEDDLYPGLLNLAFFVSALRVTATTVALGGVIFLAMPRRPSMARTHTGLALPRHLTGFDEEVKLGQLGEILENDSVVMNVELYDAKGNRMASPAEPLWRGVTMAEYANGRWKRQHVEVSEFPPISSERLKSPEIIQQQIRLESTDSSVLFGLRPMLDARSKHRSSPDLNRIDGTIVRSDPRSETYDYRVISAGSPDEPQLGEDLPSFHDLRLLLGVPGPIEVAVRTIAERQLGEIPPEEPILRARALEEYLRSSGSFQYSLQQRVVDPKLDPVLDFLANRKEGHCAYFASALTLMLRSIGIPARMVNGFKGGDWNDLAQALSVRQKHAHSWVEALIQTDPSVAPVWITLDPTPGAGRNEAVASVGRFASNFREITDLIRYIWVFYIVGYNTDRQQFLLYDPIRRLIVEARSGFEMMGGALQWAAKAVFGFRDFAAFISVRGFFVSFAGLLAFVGLFRGVLWIGRRGLRWYRGDREDSASLSASQVSYRRLTQLLTEFGLDRPPAETQHEFANRASAFLTGRGSSTLAVTDVPPLVVAAYYSVRFGQREISPAMLDQLERRLDALEASLLANGN